jgi:hypothetical protein
MIGPALDITSTGTAAKKISLLLGLIAKPEMSLKSSRASLTIWIDGRSADAMINKSSAKLR